MKNFFTISSIFIIIFSSCSISKNKDRDISKSHLRSFAATTLDSLYKHYSIEGSHLLRENYPFDAEYTATYLASDEQKDRPNAYAYLWPYSGTFSAVNALYELTHESKYKNMLHDTVLPGLEEYLDSLRTPTAYASYVNTAPTSDRFYDDNVWIGIDYTDIYMSTKEQKYLDKAQMIWKFIESGMDDKLGGGIYWCEQKKHSKNTCSNAPGSVYALKLFQATGDSTYFHQGLFLYDWTKKNLQDSSDYLYYDNVSLNGRIGKTKYAYNSGQMMQAAALLYRLTNNQEYLKEAQNIAKSCYNYFFTDYTMPEGESFRILKDSDTWFAAVMLRGFIELYNIDKDKTFVDAYQKSLEHTWNNVRSEDGLFQNNKFGSRDDSKIKWLLTQAAMVEMYARLANL